MIEALRHPGFHLVTCDAIADGVSVDVADDAGLLLERAGGGRLFVRAVGALADVRRDPRAGRAERHDRSGCVVIPGLVNAHAHLDLTHIGPRPYDAERGFAGWIDMVRRERAADAAAVAASVRAGVDLAVRGGTVLIGDIAGAVAGRASDLSTRALAQACAETGLHAVSFIEFFAQSAKWLERVEQAWQVAEVLRSEIEKDADGGRVIVGLQPHAPYSVHLDAYAEMMKRCDGAGMPICTHLAESVEEAAMIAAGVGPFRDLLEAVGVWDECTAGQYGLAASPVGHMCRHLGRGMGVVHVNHASRLDLFMLMGYGTATNGTPTPVTYCPRASAYFRAADEFGPHRYRHMRQLSLGTDSAINIPASDLARRGLCMLDEARILVERDGREARGVLRAITVGGEEFLLARAGDSIEAPGVDIRREMQSQFAPGVDLLGVLALPMSRADLRRDVIRPAAHAAILSSAPPEILGTGRLRAFRERPSDDR